VLVAWGVAGALSLAGALSYAELGAMFPEAGGEYVYLRQGWGPGLGFLYGWTRFWIGTPGSIAAYAVGSAVFLGGVLPVEPGNKAVAIAIIAVFTLINCLRVVAGGGVQTALTALKVVLIAALAGGALLAPSGSWHHLAHAGAFPGGSAFGAMVLAALWAYDGWNNLPMAAGEVRDPARNLPRALVGGALAVIAIYAAVNIGYFHALPAAEVARSSSNAYPAAPPVAAKVASQFLGSTAQALLAVAMAISAISAMNGAILTGARVPFAAARDGLAPQALARVAERARVPVVSVLVQGAIACVYALSGKFDQLTNAVVFASWLFYGLNAGSVLLLRLREPDRERAFRVPGFPVVPVAFMALALLLLVNALWATPWESALGIGVTAIGAAMYAIRYRGK
jgi:APA family basic amino acid/polyamine antiporter